MFACSKNEVELLVNTRIDIDGLERAPKDSTSVSSIRYVNLETTKESCFSRIRKIRYRNDLFFIMTSNGEEGLFLFSKQGEFVTKIKQIGKGEGEFLSVSDFNVLADGSIYIWDYKLDKLLIFNSNFEFQQEYVIDCFFEEMVVFTNSEMLCYNGKKYQDDQRIFTISF